MAWACIEGCIVLLMVTAWPAHSDAKAGDRVVPLHAPDERTIPEGPVGDAIRYGKKVLTETQRYAPAYVGNGLNCTSCHLDAGRKAWASPWVSNADAVDVAAYFTRKPRPDFAAKSRDWPKGDKPSDVPY